MPVPVLAGEMLFFVRTSHMDVANAENAGAFFHKEKYPKENRLTPLAPCASRIYRVLLEETCCPSGNVRHPRHTPNGLFPTNAPMLGAA
jgi:hypothetical protein